MIYWHTGVSASDSVDAVLRFAREFQASWSPEEMAHLPQDCRPSLVKSAGDLDFWADRLSEEYLRQVQTANIDTVLAEFVHFFLHAAMRCKSILAAEASPESNAAGRDGSNANSVEGPA